MTALALEQGWLLLVLKNSNNAIFPRCDILGSLKILNAAVAEAESRKDATTAKHTVHTHGVAAGSRSAFLSMVRGHEDSPWNQDKQSDDVFRLAPLQAGRHVPPKSNARKASLVKLLSRIKAAVFSEHDAERGRTRQRHHVDEHAQVLPWNCCTRRSGEGRSCCVRGCNQKQHKTPLVPSNSRLMARCVDKCWRRERTMHRVSSLEGCENMAAQGELSTVHWLITCCEAEPLPGRVVARGLA